MKSCESVRRQIDAYIDNELAPGAHDEVLRHLTVCQACQSEVQVRTAIKQRVRQAVFSQQMDSSLQVRIRAAVRQTDRPAQSLGRKPRFMVAGAMLAVCLGGAIEYQLGHFRITAASQESFVQQLSARVPNLMRVGLGDHVHCAVFRKLPKDSPTLDELTRTIGAKFAGLVPSVQSKVSGKYRIMMAHHCRYNGRSFVHMTLQGQSKLISLIISRKVGSETFGREHLTAAISNSEMPVYRAGVQAFEIAGFETQDYLAFVVSDLPPDQNLFLTASLAPEVRTFFQ